MRMKKNPPTMEGARCPGFVVRGNGRRRAISTSNTRKTTANRKNRIENGSRALFLGSKPHSNGEAFSRSIREREDIRRVRIIITDGTIIARIIFNRRGAILESISVYIFELKVQCLLKLSRETLEGSTP